MPALAVGHVVLHVADTQITERFYRRLGLRPVWLAPAMAILELRGGTHLLLFRTSRRGRSKRAAPFDLMADDLAAARASARTRRLSPSAIAHDVRSGHTFFVVEDPDGHRVTVYSSHTEGRLV